MRLRLRVRRLLARRARVLGRGALRHTELVGQARVGLREHAERRGAVRLEPVPHLVTIKVGVTLTLSLTPDLTLT